MKKDNIITNFLADLYQDSNNVLTAPQVKKILDVFTITCNKCGEKVVEISAEKEPNGYCGTCYSGDDFTFVLKCTGCGAAINVRR